MADEILDTLEAQAVAQQEIIFNSKEELKLLKERKAITGDLNVAEKTRVEAAKESLVAAQRELEALKAANPELEKRLALLEKQMNLLNGIGQQTRDILKTTTGITETTFSDTFIGKVHASRKAFGNLKKVQQEVGAAIHKTFHPMNVLTGQLKKVALSSLALVYQQESAIATFKTATGATKDYSNSIVELEKSHRQMGISAADASVAVTGLFSGMAQFTELSDPARDKVILLAASLEKFGVATATTAKIQQDAQSVFKMSGAEALSLQGELVGTSDALGLTLSSVQEGFKDAMPSLAKFGKEGKRIFKETAAASKALKIEMGRLIEIAQQFQTFEAAATAAGKLNVMLGGPFFDDIELLNASFEGTSEVLKVMRKGFDESGRSLDSMTAAEKVFLAKSAGLSDVSELQKILNGDLDSYLKKADQQEVIQKQLNERLREAMPIMDKLKMIMMSFALSMRWVVNGLHALADALVGTSGEVGTLLKVLGLSTAAMLIAYQATKAYAGYKTFVVPVLNRLGIAKAKDTAATVSGTVATKAAEAADRASVAAKAASTAATKASSAAAKALAAAKAASTAATKAGTAATEVQTVVQKKAGKVASTFGAQMLKFAFAILLVGAGVYMAATGVGNLVASFKGLGDAASTAVWGIIALMTGLTVAMVVLALLAPAAGTAATGVFLLGLAVTMVGAGIMLIGTGISIAINSITRLISVLAKLKIDSLTQLSDAMSSMADFGSRNIGAGSSLVEFRRTVNAIVRLENVKGIEHTKGVVDQIMRLKNEAPTVNITQKASETKPIELTINLDGKGIYKKVHKDLNEKLEIQTYTR